MKKRGISPLISTILIIGFTIVLAAFVIQWGLGSFQKYKESSDFESRVALACSDVNFKINEACILFNTTNIVLENLGSGKIKGFLYRVKSDKGVSVTDSQNGLNEYSQKTILDAGFDALNLGTPKEIEIFPKILLDKKEVICDFSRKAEIKNCFSLLNFQDTSSFSNNAGNIGKSLPGEDGAKDVYFAILEAGSDELKTLAPLSINTIPPSDYILITLTDGSSNGYVSSEYFEIPDNPLITHLGIFGETNSNVKYELVDESNNVVKTLYTGFENIQSAFSYRVDISDLKGTKVKLKIDYNGVADGSYSALYRFCFTDSHSSCIV